MKQDEHNPVTARIVPQYTWRPGDGPNRLTWRSAQEWKKQCETMRIDREKHEAELESAGSHVPDMVRDINDRFGEPPRVKQGRKRLPVSGTWPGWYEARDMIAIALGAPEPRWMNGMLWHERDHYPLAGVESAEEIRRLSIPDWPRLEIVKRMLASRERWQRECPDEPASGFGQGLSLTVPGRGPVWGVFYPSFVDLGVYLMGMTRFLTVLAGETELATAAMDLCFKLSTSYMEFLLSVYPERFEALGAFGGDTTAMLSPTLYKPFSAAWDVHLFEYARAKYNLPADIPCNLHSCGASSHLYGPWGEHPYRQNIGTMQTRLIPGHVGRLRKALPDAQLELTIAVPEFDIARVRPDEVHEIVWTSARDAGFRDVHFTVFADVHRPDMLPALERNLPALVEAVEQARREGPKY